jgi:soluble lytic murein transglycosylase-like protein
VRRIASLIVCLVLLAGSRPAEANGAVSNRSRVELRQIVERISTEHGVDPKLIDALVRVESSYNPNAVSRKGAMGLMQLMPETAERLDVENPFDPAQNVRGGVKEFSRLVRRYGGNLQLALAAYNAGEGAVAKYRGVPPYDETRSYVSKILSLYTGRPYRLAGSYRAAPVRMLKSPGGSTIITNVGSSRASGQVEGTRIQGGPLRGGFGTSQ